MAEVIPETADADIARAVNRLKEELEALTPAENKDTFGFTENERMVMRAGRDPQRVCTTRTRLLDRDGVTADGWEMALARATVITFSEGSLKGISPQWDIRLMGDALPRAYYHWSAVTGGAGSFTYLAELYVVPAFRNHGVGTELLKQIMHESASPYLYLAANANDGSSAALFRFYERHGFLRIGDNSIMYRHRQAAQTTGSPK